MMMKATGRTKPPHAEIARAMGLELWQVDQACSFRNGSAPDASIDLLSVMVVRSNASAKASTQEIDSGHRGGIRCDGSHSAGLAKERRAD